MILSILVYTLTAIIMYSLAKSVSERERVLSLKTGRKLSMYSWEIVLTFIVFCFIAGVRYNVGVDHLYYLAEYKYFLRTGSLIKDTFESGFAIITSIFARLGLHYFFFFAFWAFLQLFFVYKSCKDEKFLLPYIALTIMLGPFFLDWMNGIRQCVVSCFFVYAVRYIENKKYISYIIGIILCSFIHRSAIILLPFLFLSFKPIVLKNKTVNYIILLLCIIWGYTPVWISMTSDVANVLGVLGYEDYSSRYSEMIDLDNFKKTAWGPSRLGILMTELIIIYVYPQLREFYTNKKKIDILFFLFFIGVCFYNLFVNTSHIFLRPIQHLTIMKLPLIAYTLYYLKKSKQTLWYDAMCMLVFSYIYFIVYKSVVMPTEYTEPNLYKFFFWSVEQ